MNGRSAIRLLAVLSSVSLTTDGRALDEPLTRVQIGRIGKAATALVEVKAAHGQGYGSAFCIHPSGWFLTNAHVAEGQITLVLNPSLPAEKAYPARVVRSDAKVDLALLRAEGARDLAALSLGSDDDLEELTDVVAFGFPLVGSQRRAATAGRRSASTRGASRPCVAGMTASRRSSSTRS